MFRRLVLLGAACALAVLLSGCVTMRSHVTLNANGSADVEYILALDSKFAGLMRMPNPNGGAQQDPFVEMRTNFEKEGFKVSEYKQDDKEGLRAVKHVADVKGLSEALSSKAIGSNDKLNEQTGGNPYSKFGDGIKVQRGLFTDTYDMNVTLDLTSMGKSSTPPASSNDPSAMGRQFGEQMAAQMVDMTFALTLPTKAKSTNATKVSDGGRTMEWKLTPGQKTEMKATVVAPNTRNIALAGGGGGLLLLFVIGMAISAARRRS